MVDDNVLWGCRVRPLAALAGLVRVPIICRRIGGLVIFGFGVLIGIELQYVSYAVMRCVELQKCLYGAVLQNAERFVVLL
ncbi:hypothetical protein Nepgr_024761 [Nepenthes gracilis]|uniref:Uncharacterized protein n=1 Tax=Nepenthes gracilis TaxID=150966 RepID=A0AAD3XZ34_NEPGR|nr:hypothetical protein Nepgr_024761 [Nepenthes gracilis]